MADVIDFPQKRVVRTPSTISKRFAFQRSASIVETGDPHTLHLWSLQGVYGLEDMMDAEEIRTGMENALQSQLIERGKPCE